MPVQRAVRIALALAVIGAPLAAQGTLPAYAPAHEKYRVISTSTTSQSMMGQIQMSESGANQLISVAVDKAGVGFTLTMTLDSAVVTATGPGQSTDLGDAIGMKLLANMAPDGKVASSSVTTKAGGPPTSPLASNMRSILPRLTIGASKGAVWIDSSTTTGKQGDADLSTSTVTSFTFVGDTVIGGTKGWTIAASGVSALTGAGNRGGADYSISGEITSRSTAVVSTDGVLLGISADSDSNLTVVVPMANMTIPMSTKQHTNVERVP